LSKAAAWLQGRDYVLPRDVKFIFSDCIEHRLLWSPDLPDPYSRASALQEIFSGVKAPSIR
jgi:MoxR-like ATPase